MRRARVTFGALVRLVGMSEFTKLCMGHRISEPELIGLLVEHANRTGINWVPLLKSGLVTKSKLVKALLEHIKTAPFTWPARDNPTLRIACTWPQLTTAFDIARYAHLSEASVRCALNRAVREGQADVVRRKTGPRTTWNAYRVKWWLPEMAAYIDLEANPLHPSVSK